jgi:beta-lactamase superfamily II metal-dependent hydrolase
VKLTVFQAGSGDCLLLEARGARVLVDGGWQRPYRDHVAPALDALQEAGEEIDLVYLSHIDDDHIAGVLQLLRDALRARVHDYQVERSGNPSRRPFTGARPPKVHEIWHNGFKDQVRMSEGPILDMLATTAATLEVDREPGDAGLAQTQRELATSVGQAIELSRHLQDDLLRIPLNKRFGGKLAVVREGGRPVRIGDLRLTLLGPHEEDLEALRREWEDWLEKPANAERVKTTKARLAGVAGDLATGDVKPLRSTLELAAGELGDRADVTAPNLASLMLLADDGSATALLTGDGHSDDVLKGLRRAGRLDARDSLHVDVLKVPHHGARANVRPEFCRQVTADHYVFCGNGAHHNPEPEVVDLFLEGRLARPGAFKLWFSASETTATGDGDPALMRDLERRVSARFLEASSFAVEPLPA